MTSIYVWFWVFFEERLGRQSRWHGGGDIKSVEGTVSTADWNCMPRVNPTCQNI